MIDYITGRILDISNIAGLRLEEPKYILLLPILIVFVILLLRKEFVNTKIMSRDVLNARRKVRWVVFFTRILIFLMILIALSRPYKEVTEKVAGDPKLVVLTDESKSMEVIDTSFKDNLINALKARIPTNVKSIASGEDSSLGEGIVASTEPGVHVLLISDGNVNKGVSLEDAAFFASSSANISVNYIIMKPKEKDYSIYITGPGKLVENTPAKFYVRISGTDREPMPITITIDGTTVFDETTTKRSFLLERTFEQGTHKITATIKVKDYFLQNNEFFKTVSVIKKPDILLVTRESDPLEYILKELYSVTKIGNLPEDLNKYYAVVINDVPSNNLRATKSLHEYLIDEDGEYYGGGLVVFGGFNSFDRGYYKASPIENFLPVTVGKAKPKKGDSNIVIIMDVSGGSAGVRYERAMHPNGTYYWKKVIDEVSALDIIKAQTNNLISSDKNIMSTNKVGVIAFGVQAIGEDYTAEKSVRVVEPLDYLYNNRKKLQDKIPRIVGGGESAIDVALRGAYDMLKNAEGDKSIILMTDGNVFIEVQKRAAMVAQQLVMRGVKIYTYGVGRTKENIQEPFMKAIAEIGDGFYEGPYFSTVTKTPPRISIQWGDPEEKGFGDEFGLVIFSQYHFITKDIDSLSATMNGYNEVVPKTTAKVLIMTSFGRPALSVWNYGNGRVAAWNVFTGGGLGQLLDANNSEIITRTINWAIGDPSRKELYFVDIEDARIGDMVRVKVKSKNPINYEGLEFIKQGDYFTTSFEAEKTGFFSVLNRDYAVNYNTEYQEIGMNDVLNATASMTNGFGFLPEQVDEIIEHIKEVSRTTITKKKDIRWMFVVVALTLLLIEIFIRRIMLNKR